MSSTDLIVVVREVASSLGMLDDGKLIRLDSLGILDFVVELEKSSNIAIPADALRPEAFSSIESVAAMLHAQSGA